MKMTQAISFNKTGYDPFIDFLKAYAIIFVVVAHCLPVSLYNVLLFRIWGDMQVPMFILIQTFHAYKKGTAPLIKWNSMLKRIVIPFAVVQIIILSCRLLFSADTKCNVLISSVYGGGVRTGFLLFLDIHTSRNYPCLDMAVSTKTYSKATYLDLSNS